MVETASIPFLSSYLDYFYTLKIFLVLKNRSDKNPIFLKSILLSINHFTYSQFLPFPSLISFLSFYAFQASALVELALYNSSPPLVLIGLECLYNQLSRSLFGQTINNSFNPSS